MSASPGEPRRRLLVDVDGDAPATPEPASGSRRPRIAIVFDDSGTAAPPAPPQAAALIGNHGRIELTGPPARIAPGPAGAIVASGHGGVAVIAPTASGHAIEVLSPAPGVLLNGERLLHGERRPLEAGDTLAIGPSIAHFVAAGARASAPLAPITPIEAGRVAASRDLVVLGRDESCDLRLDHPTVLRRHATIEREGGVPLLRAVNARALLRVNGQPLREARLADGDQIAIGPFRVVFDGQGLVGRDTTHGLPVSASGVTVRAGDTTILQPTDVELRPGELVALIGESGAGKTTLLKALAGVRRPSGGTILLGGEAVAERQRDIGYVPQFDVVHRELTVFEALDYGARLRLPADTAPAERIARVREVIAELGLEGRADVRVGALSGGQRKRASVGMELLHRPGALFLDEPTTGLDPGLERRMMQLFRGLADNGHTVTLVTHATASLALCDRVVVMARGGRLWFDGAPDELREELDGSFEELYDRLDALDGAPPRAAPGAGRATGVRALPPLGRPARDQRQVQQPFGSQVAVLAERYAKLLLRDRRSLRSALIQVPVLALMTALLFDGNVFERGAPGLAGKAAQLLFLMVTIAVWLGSINAAREIVKERPVVARELAVGVQVPAYLASKVVVLFALTTMQVLAFFALVTMLRPLHESITVAWQLAFVLVLSSWVAVLLGLIVSAASSSEDQATGVIPLLLVPQLLFAGSIVALKDMGFFMHLVAALVPARWSYATAGHVMDLNARFAADPGWPQPSRYGGAFFGIATPVFVVVAGLFGAGLLAALTRLVTRSRTT